MLQAYPANPRHALGLERANGSVMALELGQSFRSGGKEIVRRVLFSTELRDEAGEELVNLCVILKQIDLEGTFSFGSRPFYSKSEGHTVGVSNRNLFWTSRVRFICGTRTVPADGEPAKPRQNSTKIS